MKTLFHHVLIFDHQCPLCKTYTGVFIKAGLLESKGLKPYNEIEGENYTQLDLDRARNEIALVNTQTGEVTYGLDSLLKIVGNGIPLLKPVFETSAFQWFFRRLYKFISFNRKVIIPTDANTDRCIPDVNVKYRWVFIVFAWLVTSLVLTHYSAHLAGLIPVSRFFREFMICGGQILFQGVLMNFIAKPITLDYLGNMMTISLAGSLVLLVGEGVCRLCHVTSPLVYAAIFMGTAGLMLLEHLRRMKLLHLPLLASLGWVVYRIIVLIIITL